MFICVVVFDAKRQVCKLAFVCFFLLKQHILPRFSAVPSVKKKVLRSLNTWGGDCAAAFCDLETMQYYIVGMETTDTLYLL